VSEGHVQQTLGLATAITCVTIAATGLSFGVLLISFVLDARGTSGLVIGLVATMGGLATIFVAPVTPWLLRQLGSVRTLLAAITLMAASFGALYWAEAIWLWFFLRFLNGAGVAVLLVTSEFWINARVSSRRRGLTLGLYTAAQSLGFAAGPALLAATGSEGSLPFALGSGLMLLSALPALAGGNSIPAIGEAAKPSLLSFSIALPTAMLAAFVFGALEASTSLLPIYGLRLGEPETIAALLAMAVALGNVVFQVPIGFISDKVDRRGVLLACALIALVSTLLMPFAAASTIIFLALLVFWGGVIAGLYSVGLALVASHYRGAALAQANATFVTSYSIGSIAGPAATGIGIDLWNPHGFTVAMALFLLVYVCMAMIRFPSTQHEAET
jgi:MFS family permease